jgi:hypothetical protein
MIKYIWLAFAQTLKAHTLRRRRGTFDWINELIWTLIQAWGFTLNAKPKQHGVSLYKLGYRETE